MYEDSGPPAGSQHGCLHGCLLAASGAARGTVDSRALALATLVSWLITEGLGAYMLGSWIASGGLRQQRARPDRLPRPVIFGHAGLALTGFAWWVSYLVTGSAALAWVAIGFLAPAVGLGLSTVTVWTPFPVRRSRTEAKPAGLLTDEMLARALSDQVRTGELVDDLLASMLAVPPPTARRPRWHLAPLIPAAHGVTALATILLAVLAAIPAT